MSSELTGSCENGDPKCPNYPNCNYCGRNTPLLRGTAPGGKYKDGVCVFDPNICDIKGGQLQYSDRETRKISGHGIDHYNNWIADLKKPETDMHPKLDKKILKDVGETGEDIKSRAKKLFRYTKAKSPTSKGAYLAWDKPKTQELQSQPQTLPQEPQEPQESPEFEPEPKFEPIEPSEDVFDTSALDDLMASLEQPIVELPEQNGDGQGSDDIDFSEFSAGFPPSGRYTYEDPNPPTLSDEDLKQTYENIEKLKASIADQFNLDIDGGPLGNYQTLFEYLEHLKRDLTEKEKKLTRLNKFNPEVTSQKTIDNLQNKIQQLEQQLEQQSVITMNDPKLGELNELNKLLQQELQNCKENLDKATSGDITPQDAEKIGALEETIEELGRTNEVLKSELGNRTDELMKKEDQIRQLQAEMMSFNPETIQNYENQIAGLQDNNKELNDQLAGIDEEHEKQIKKLGERMQLVGKQLEEKQKEIQEQQRTITKLTEGGAGASSEALTKAYEKLKKYEEDLVALKKNKTEYYEEKEAAEELYKKQLQQKESEIKKLNNEKEDLEGVNEKFRQLLTECQDEKDKCNENRRAADKELQEAREELQTLGQEYKLLEKNATEAFELYNTFKQQNERLKQQLEQERVKLEQMESAPPQAVGSQQAAMIQQQKKKIAELKEELGTLTSSMQEQNQEIETQVKKEGRRYGAEMSKKYKAETVIYVSLLAYQLIRFIEPYVGGLTNENKLIFNTIKGYFTAKSDNNFSYDEIATNQDAQNVLMNNTDSGTLSNYKNDLISIVNKLIKIADEISS